MNLSNTQNKNNIVVKFAGDSGDGMQLTGNQMAQTNAIFGNDISTFPDFPAEIRAPIGTVPGVSGFQLHFGDTHILTPGDKYDVLVVMNAAALKTNLTKLSNNAIIILNSEGFDDKNLRLAKIDINDNPLHNGILDGYKVISIEITKLTKNAVKDFGLGNKDAERCKNMFVLGVIYWMFNRSMDYTKDYLLQHFSKNEKVAQANIAALKAGYYFAETSEIFDTQFNIAPSEKEKGIYRSFSGNQAVAMGFLAASVKTNLPLFLGTYPITPASDILHELSKFKNFNVYSFQAEDEIAGICAAIGASYSGNIGITTSSGPGIALKTEAIGLATMLELPLVVCNVQRGGPSTGMPTKTEQADLLQAMYGRNGECPVVVIAAQTPSDCYTMAYNAIKIALEHTVPVFLLSDGFLANGAEPWKVMSLDDLPDINHRFISTSSSSTFMPYTRNDDLSRNIAIPGSIGLENRIGGIEKENITGNISYDGANHELMVKLRAQKVANVAHGIPLQTFNIGDANSNIVVVGWGSTYGAITSAINELNAQGNNIAHIHLKYINPMPLNFEELIAPFQTVLVVEMNNGQLVKLLRDKLAKNAIGINKIQGQPFTISELKQNILQHIQSHA